MAVVAWASMSLNVFLRATLAISAYALVLRLCGAVTAAELRGAFNMMRNR